MQNPETAELHDLNRQIPPAFQPIADLTFPVAQRLKLSNGIPVYSIDAGTQEVVKIDLIFNAGAVYQPQSLIASAANSLITAGTSEMTADAIAERFDFYGAYCQCDVNMDQGCVALFTLNKYLEPTLALLEHVVKHPEYPQNEIDTHLRNAKQEFVVNQEKVSMQARRNFRNLLYGDQHPYGRLVSENSFDQVQRDTLIDFHRKSYHPANLKIIVAGRVPANLMQLLEHHFGSNDWQSHSDMEPASVPETSPESRFIQKADALQSAIRIGRRMFTRNHVDFMPMQLLNTVLGGYFGSRLMSNIREDKGYTYGIGSGLSSWKQAGHFFIASEVGRDVTQPALDEIYKEIARLREEAIPAQELQLVKNYLSGSLVKSLDGPFALADRLKGLLLADLNESYYTKLLHTIHATTAQQLQDLANKYWQQEDLVELVVGNKITNSTL